MSKAVYIHIPFCTQICHYCDFNKVYLKGQPVEEYLHALRMEMEHIFEITPPTQVETVFIGGGTPTALNEEQLKYLMETVQSLVHVKKLKEYTIEANPGDLTENKLKILKAYGVNRLSLGVQSFNDKLLEAIGRSHRVKDVYTTVEAAKQNGFTNISIDLMYGLPNQTKEDVQFALDEFFKLDIEHCSAYSLIVEPKTVFYNLMNRNKLPLPSEDEEAIMYKMIMEQMERHGYNQYEISNYTREGFESKHNIVYWDNEEYYGFGAGAHSYLNSIRRSNLGPIKHYITQVEKNELPVREEIPLTKKEQIEEEMFLGLRKNEGVSIQKFTNKYGQNPLEYYNTEIEKLTNDGLLTITDNYIKLTEHGRMLGNLVFQQFIKS
ncbi:radical SAM family heme chaperone HemW [Bacillus andreraoultii]|uniref:radical SAM family heme chaperone HemW n=1 Tax=Bacillus andreraoultii TaxID=1499685 RepID=UPI000539C7B5|nr:radical SAM family heme chaperone HemW [Bacillus andreraoultii]